VRGSGAAPHLDHRAGHRRHTALGSARMTALFYIAAVVAVLSTLMVVTRTNLVHALLYLVVSLFAVAVVFYTLGAPFVAALEVIVYAGAIIMLFLFAVMLLNVSADSPLRVPLLAWLGPAILVAILLAEVIYGVTRQTQSLHGAEIGPQAVSEALYGPYVLGVELASMLLLAALVGARHVAARARDEEEAAESMEHARAQADAKRRLSQRGTVAEQGVIVEDGDA
jgi:NADH-quinone oxidoreductase subunit J